MPAPTTTIRVRIETRDRLKVVAASLGESTADLVDRWVRGADEELLLADAAAAWDAMSEVELARYRADQGQLDSFSAELPRY